MARRGDRLQALADTIHRDHPEVRVRSWITDVRDEAGVRDAVAAIGGVDILVNNAGLGRAAPLLSGNTEDWREMLETNVLALCVCTREAIADMRRRGDRGHVVHISSLAAHRVPFQSGVYAASKYAVRALTEGLRRELHAEGSRIRITSVSPGFVRTEFAAVYERDPAAIDRTYDRFRVLDPADVADTVAHVLAMPEHVQIHDVLVRSIEQPD
jgi:NADP-dependent 3-hydroxy acid dehydrogenase YdfG